MTGKQYQIIVYVATVYGNIVQKIEIEGTVFLLGQDAASLLGVTPTTVYRLIKEGHLSGIKVGKHWLLREDEVNAYKPRKPGRPKSTKPN